MNDQVRIYYFELRVFLIISAIEARTIDCCLRPRFLVGPRNIDKRLQTLKYCEQQWLGRPIQLLSSIYICKNTSFFNSYLKRRGRRGRRGNEGEKRRKMGKNLEP